MYNLLCTMAERPAPFCQYTAPDLWTRPHIAASMLAFHIDGSNDLASRKQESIVSIVDWIAERFAVDGKRVCDLGCGPGLYANRLAQKGAQVTGVDISTSSLAYARGHAPSAAPTGAPSYRLANYLEDPLPQEQDLVLLIYADYCALSPSQRRTLLARMRAQLNPGGAIVFDVFSDHMFQKLEESTVLESDLMGGFWAPSPYVGLKKSWLWPETTTGLDHYLIACPDETFEIYNWMQYFSPHSLKDELQQCGFDSPAMIDFQTGSALGADYGDAFGAIVTV
nr:class I SAM-dependent methyltransferase [uncultured Cohaesibacter sp.]